MRPLPIRWKFALWAASLVGVVVVLFAGGAFMNLYREQIEAVDVEIEVHRKQILSLSPPDFALRTPEELAALEPWLGIAVFDPAGQIGRCSSSLPEDLARLALAESSPRTLRDKAGQNWRVISFPVGDSTVALCYLLNEIKDLVHDLLIAYALSLPVAILVAAAGGWWVSGRALAPLRELAATAESVRADQLDRRLPATGGQDEIQRLAVVLNAMLARLQQSFHQSQRFAADASHELRTPLTIMRGEIERMLRSPQLDHAHEEKLVSLQEEIVRLDRITEHLLLLARFDAGQVAVTRAPVDFSALVRTACEDAELIAAAQSISIRSIVGSDIVVQGDAVHLRRMVLALLDNAIRYNQPQGEVHCALDVTGKWAQLHVRNTGAGIPADRQGQLFQRFFRADPARTTGGHGLGLSLAREIARAHGGDVVLDPTAQSGWTEFVVTLPRAN